jgi:ferredoxin
MKSGIPLKILRFLLALTVLGIVVAEFWHAAIRPAIAGIQFGPAIMTLATRFTFAVLAIAIGILLGTILFGRYFCAVLCPLGTIQDAMGALRKSGVSVPNLKWIRYGVTAVSCALFLAGWNIGFRLLDPFSRVGSAMSGIRDTLVAVWSGAGTVSWTAVLGGVLPLAVLAGLVLWKKRIYCTALCPVGTILGLFAKNSLFGMRFTNACIACGQCASSCPTGCIDACNRHVDRERCVLCLACISACRSKGLAYRRQSWQSHPQPDSVDASRRVFLAKGMAAALGVFAAGSGMLGLTNFTSMAGEDHSGRIYPPGAGHPDRFYQQCTGCQLCAAKCPTNVIKPTWLGFGPVRLDYSAGRCDYDCAECGSVCPTGALQKLSLDDKRYTRIGQAAVELILCRVATDNVPCDLCAQACPVKAIYMVDNPQGPPAPEVNAFHCIGCGACQHICPVRPRAVTVASIGEQQLM